MAPLGLLALGGLVRDWLPLTARLHGLAAGAPDRRTHRVGDLAPALPPAPALPAASPCAPSTTPPTPPASGRGRRGRRVRPEPRLALWIRERGSADLYEALTWR